MENRRQPEANGTSFAEVFKASGISAQPHSNKGASNDSRLMIYSQGMKVYIPDEFQPETLLKLLQVLKQL